MFSIPSKSLWFFLVLWYLCCTHCSTPLFTTQMSPAIVIRKVDQNFYFNTILAPSSNFYAFTMFQRCKMEHSELVNEMTHVEHMSTQERLHLARRRRNQQLKLWGQREREWERSRQRHKDRHPPRPRIVFSDSVMLLEGASRNDIMEGKSHLRKPLI